MINNSKNEISENLNNNIPRINDNNKFKLIYNYTINNNNLLFQLTSEEKKIIFNTKS